MSTLKKLHGGGYEVRGRCNAKQVRKRFSRKKDAQDYYRRLDVDAERRRAGLPRERGDFTYRELTDAFLGQYDRTSKKWKREMLDYSITEFGDALVRTLDSDEIGSWLHALPHGPKTKQHILDAMRQVLGQGVEWGYLARNPARSKAVQAPRASVPDVRPFGSWDEVAAVAAASDPRYSNLATFGCSTGLRPEEWIPLEWEDVNVSKRTCRIAKVCVDGVVRTDQGKTDAAFRVVRLQQTALDALAAQANPQNRLIFAAPNGGLIDLDNWRERFWKKAFDGLSIEYRPLLQMRHTYATLALSAGADLYFISKELGHRDIRTTLKYYARFQPSVDERNLGLLDAFSADTDTEIQTDEADPDVS